MVEDLLSRFLESFVTTWAPALSSGFILLWTHHSKVKQEIEINIKLEQFERRRSIYRELLAISDQMYDWATMVSDEQVNWRIFRKLHDELQVAGSPMVIKKFDNLFSELSSRTGPE